ncbi:MAG TPA: cation:proton antiporter [Acidimicrobiales bacterium]|nr:cation:proton antiporter [Acidimicrobiales bacterium]
MNLVAPSEHQLLVFWTTLAVLLLVARLLGGAMRRIGQPAVVGELTAGLLLGPSVLGQVAPGATAWLFPADNVQSGMLFTVGWIGVVLLLVVTGFETDLTLIRRLGSGAAFVSAGSLLVPIALGAVVGFLLPGIFVADPDQQVVFGLFIATALSISSLPVIAKILGELGLMRRNFGQMTLAAGIANDVVGWVLLGLIAGLAQAGEIALGRLALTLAGMTLFLVGSLTVGQRAVDVFLRRLRRTEAGVPATITTYVVIALLAGVVTQALGVEAVLGAFVAGIVLGRSKFRQVEVEHQLESVTAAVFAPVFFATAGLRVDLALLAEPQVLFWSAVVVAVASVSKILGAWIGAKAARLPGREGLALGIGLNARGAFGLIIATVGLSLGVLNQASYTVLVIMSIVTSMMAGPMLRWVVRSWAGTVEEQKRLLREETLSRNVMVKPTRFLLPTTGGPNSIVAAQVMHLAWPPDVGATLLIAGKDVDEQGIEAITSVLGDRSTDIERVSSEDAPDVILREARLGYGAIGVGAPDEALGRWILSPVVDELLQETSVPVVIVRRARNLDRPTPGAFARAVVPVSAARPSRAAQEIAGHLSANIGTEVVLTHIAAPARDALTRRLRGVFGRRPDAPEAAEASGGSSTLVDAQGDVATKILERAEALADELGARSRSVVRRGTSKPDEIIQTVIDEDADLVVLGADLRQLEGRPFLGHGVEHVLDACAVTVVVVATPTGDPG